MAKRGATNDEDGKIGVHKRPRFPRVTNQADIYQEMNSGTMIVRDNTNYLAELSKLTLFTRPTQLGKTTFLALGELVYSKTETAPTNIAIGIPESQRNKGYAIQFDFLKVHTTDSIGDVGWKAYLKAIDLAFFEYIKWQISDFLDYHQELQPYFKPYETGGTAGDYLNFLSNAVFKFSKINHTNEFLVVLVDEYDEPLRNTLMFLLEQIDQFDRSTVIDFCPHYVSFFRACKTVGQALPENKVWVTGVLPIALDLISGFKPENLTFDENLLNAVGLRDQDVDKMLQLVHDALPFENHEQMQEVRMAIRDHANHLQFLSGDPLYHTRMVNELMNQLADSGRRVGWLRNLTRMTVTRESAPTAIYKLLQTSQHCRKVAKALASQRDIFGTLNERLNLVDVANTKISANNYMTLLVHLGVASVHLNVDGDGHIFRATSRYFRSEFLEEMLGVTLKPLFECRTVAEIYQHQDLLQDFIETIPISGMEKMIKWAQDKAENRILELQFQGFLVGKLHSLFLEDEVPFDTTQEDKLASDLRTDIRIAGNSTMIVLELKQKPSKAAPPTKAQMDQFHKQLHEYVEEITKEGKYQIVAGFVVVMYANGTKFQIEPTTYQSPTTTGKAHY